MAPLVLFFWHFLALGKLQPKLTSQGVGEGLDVSVAACRISPLGHQQVHDPLDICNSPVRADENAKVKLIAVPKSRTMRRAKLL